VPDFREHGVDEPSGFTEADSYMASRITISFVRKACNMEFV